jgi:uncharacterized protein (TIGR02246 family)
VGLALACSLSAAQQNYPPDTQAAPNAPEDQQSQPQQNPDAAGQQIQPAQAEPPANQSQQTEAPEPESPQPRTPPAQAEQPQPQTTRKPLQTQPAPQRTGNQQGARRGIQDVPSGEVTIGGGTIGKLRQDWQSAWNSRRLDDLMALYSEDAVLLLPEGQRVMGRQAIRDYFQQILARGRNQIVLNSLSTYPADKLAYDDGTFKETIEPFSAAEGENASDADRRQVRGNYLTIVGKSGNIWLIREQAVDGLR